MPCLQVVLSILYTFANDVYTLINYLNFVTLTSSGAAVAGMIWVRYREPTKPRPFKVIGSHLEWMAMITICMWGEIMVALFLSELIDLTLP